MQKKWRKKPPLELLFCFAANLFFPLLADIDEFHLQLLVFHFVYRFHSRICRGYNLLIICKWQVQEDFSIISASFRISLLTLLHEKNVAFTLISFALKWDDCLSVQVPFEVPVQIPAQLFLELATNWLDQNVDELEL